MHRVIRSGMMNTDGPTSTSDVSKSAEESSATGADDPATTSSRTAYNKTPYSISVTVQGH